jgi:signal peptidase II
MPKRPLLIALAVLLLDRITKWAIAQTIPLEDAVNIVPGFFRLTHLENTGAALLIAFSVAALAVVSFLLWKDRGVFHSGTLALSLILGGAVGNLWDRLVDGKVTDFLDFYIDAHHWPPFNVADSAIVVGALLLLLRMFRKDHQPQAAG